MNTEIKTINMENTEDGHSKEWHITLWDDNTVVTTWGKIGSTLSSKEFPFDTMDEAEKFFDKKCNEKLKKGYIVV